MKLRLLLCGMVAAILLVGNANGEGRPDRAPSKEKWFMLMTNLLVKENVDKGIDILSRAAKAGYTGMVISDSKFCIWDRMPASYMDNCGRIRDAARKLGVKFVPEVAPVGYSNDLLAQDPNLAEGLPAVDAPFVATNDGHLVPVEDHPLKNGDFKEAKGDSPAEWEFVDQPGKICVLEATDGHTALRMSDIGKYDPGNGHARAEQTLQVQPFRYYHVSVRVKTQDFETPGSCQILALGASGQSLQSSNLPIERTMGWKTIDVTFNTLDNSSVNFYLGVWGGKGGTIWWSDVKIEPAGLVNLVRRQGAPFRVTSADGRTDYTEHKDYDGALDPKLGNNKWLGDFDNWHAGPLMTIPAGSRIKPGQTVKVSYCHTAFIYDGQAMICMAEPKTMDLVKWQVGQVHKYLAPDGYMLAHDEIRMTGWDASCVTTGKTPGQELAANVRACIALVRKEDPGKTVYVWSDMFDPAHNAQPKGKYYLVKGEGPWSGAWRGLDSDVVVFNWNSNPSQRKVSLAHFEDLGCRQILAGYYDGPVNAIQDWLKDAALVKGVDGVMYTTWVGNFTDLEKFAAAAGT